MLHNDLVSIITPSYNCGRFIKDTICSVQAQTYKNWEILFVDDNSTDNTEAIVKSFNDSRIHYFRNKTNKGAALSRNWALREAKGRWIAFLDSDDLWLPGKLEHQIQFMLNNDYAFSYTSYEEIDEKNQPLGIIWTGPRHISKIWMYAYCWIGCLTVMYDASQIGMIQISDIKKNNDYAIWLKICKKTKCHLLNEVLGKYRRRTGSLSNHNVMSLIKWHYQLFKNAEEYSIPVSYILTVNNLFWGCIKKIKYRYKLNT